MANCLCVSDRACKIRTQMFGFYMPVACTRTHWSPLLGRKEGGTEKRKKRRKRKEGEKERKKSGGEKRGEKEGKKKRKKESRNNVHTRVGILDSGTCTTLLLCSLPALIVWWAKGYIVKARITKT